MCLAEGIGGVGCLTMVLSKVKKNSPREQRMELGRKGECRNDEKRFPACFALKSRCVSCQICMDEMERNKCKNSPPGSASVWGLLGGLRMDGGGRQLLFVDSACEQIPAL